MPVLDVQTEGTSVTVESRLDGSALGCSRARGHMLPTRLSTSQVYRCPPAPPSSGSVKRSQHLGPSDIYLDDLCSLDSENAALYFPQRCLRSGCQVSWDGAHGARGWLAGAWQGGGPSSQSPCIHVIIGPFPATVQ